MTASVVNRSVTSLVLRPRGLLVLAAILSALAIWALGCRSAPITGRKQLVVLPEAQEVALGATAFQEVSQKEPLSTNAHYNEVVKRVGQRIAAVAGRTDYQWEFKVIASPTQNAFCLPGGKVAVYEGILPICQTEAGLAVVMSHEIAHALARHGGERMSQGYAVDLGKQAVARLSGTYDETKREMILKAYGLGSQYGLILPYSRKHESEADHIGVMLLARAGYDPDEAPRFWERFAASNTTAQPIEFLSTHPSDVRRAQDLTALLPEARQLYEAAPTRYGMGETLQITAMANSQPAAGASSNSLRTVTSPGSGAPSGFPLPGFPSLPAADGSGSPLLMPPIRPTKS